MGRRGARANKDNRGTRREHYNIVWSVAEASLAGEEQSRHCPSVRITLLRASPPRFLRLGSRRVRRGRVGLLARLAVLGGDGGFGLGVEDRRGRFGGLLGGHGSAQGVHLVARTGAKLCRRLSASVTHTVVTHTTAPDFARRRTAGTTMSELAFKRLLGLAPPAPVQGRMFSKADVMRLSGLWWIT